MNLPKAKLSEVLNLLPAEKSPTVNQLADENFLAIEVILEEKLARNLVPKLSKQGATGIFTYPLLKVIP